MKVFKTHLTVARMLLIVTAQICGNPVLAEPLPPYKNPNLTNEARVVDLLSRMTLAEKIGQMSQYVGPKHIASSEKNLSMEEIKASDTFGLYPRLHSSQIPALIKAGKIGSFLHVTDLEEANLLQRYASQSRLAIPLLIGIDAIHGNGLVRGATVYPSPITMASSWNLDLVNQSAAETAKEVRLNGAHWAFAPNIDIARDARWGRVGETFGEDDWLVSEMGVAVVEGMQRGDADHGGQILATAKHFVGGGDSVNGLNLSPMDISIRSLREDHFPPFKRAIEAGVFSLMAAHNEVNGIPAHANRFLLSQILRDEWGFKGFIVSDWMDVERLHTYHRTAENFTEAVYQSISAGIDMHMHGPKFFEPMLELARSGRISSSRIEAAVKPILLAKFRLGLFEETQVDPALAQANMFNETHQKTALELARQGIVLLKNDSSTLPLSTGTKIFVTGPNANNHSIIGDWVREQPEENINTIVEGLRVVDQGSFNIDFLDVGGSVINIDPALVEIAVQRARSADVAIVAVGGNPLRYDSKGKTSGENVARSSIGLVGQQLELVKAIHATGVPTVVILVNGRPIAEPWLVDNVHAIIEAWEPGALGGIALAEILFGRINPSGKLPITVPYSVGHLRAIYNHKPTERVRRYVDAPNENLFEFGHGLSYATFEYSSAELSRPVIEIGENTSLSVTVTNTGEVAGQEVVQLYIRDHFSEVTRPVKELKGFKRITLLPGDEQTVHFNIEPKMLSYIGKNMLKRIDAGDFSIMVGGSSNSSDLEVVQLEVMPRGH